MAFTATRHSLQPPPSAQPKQKKFPKRARLSVPSTKSELKHRRMRRKNQSTLTQLPYFSSFESKDEDGSALSDPDFEDPQPKKKRKTMAGARRKTKQEEEGELKQATLTQVGWPYPFDDSDEDAEAVDAESVDEDDEEANKEADVGDENADQLQAAYEMNPVPIEREEPVDDAEVLGENIVQQPEAGQPNEVASRSFAPSSYSESPMRNCPPARRASSQAIRHPSSSNTPRKQRASHSPELGPSTSASNSRHAAPVSPFKTPQKPARNEIPSSQSPAATPLSRSSAAAGSSSKSTPSRTPLSELHENVWAQRDESPTPKPKGKRKVVPDSEDTDELDKENLMDDLKNYDGYLSEDGSPKELRQNHSPTQRQPSSSRATQPTSSHGTGDEVFARPPLPTTGRPSRSQRLSYSQTEMNSMQAEPSTYPPGPRLTHLSPPSKLSNNYDTIRSSQASTVDVTQRSPVPSPPKQKGNDLPPGYNPNLPPLPSSPRAFESQFPYSMFSGCEDESQIYGPESVEHDLDSDVDM